MISGKSSRPALYYDAKLTGRFVTVFSRYMIQCQGHCSCTTFGE